MFNALHKITIHMTAVSCSSFSPLLILTVRPNLSSHLSAVRTILERNYRKDRRQVMNGIDKDSQVFNLILE